MGSHIEIIVWSASVLGMFFHPSFRLSGWGCDVMVGVVLFDKVSGQYDILRNYQLAFIGTFTSTTSPLLLVIPYSPATGPISDWLTDWLTKWKTPEK